MSDLKLPGPADDDYGRSCRHPDRTRSLLPGGSHGGVAGGCSPFRTVLVIGFLRSDFVFQVCRFEWFPASEEPDRILRDVAQLCQKFRIRRLAADEGGNGHVYNRLLLDRLGQCAGLYAVCCSAADHPPRLDGALTKWTVNRGPGFPLGHKKSVPKPHTLRNAFSFGKDSKCGPTLATTPLVSTGTNHAKKTNSKKVL